MAYLRKNNTLYNILDSNTGENVTYDKVTTYADGTPMDDSKCDGIIYRKLGQEYFVDNQYLQTQTVNIDRLGVVYNDPLTDNTPIIQGFLDKLQNDIPIKLNFTREEVIYVTQIRIRSNTTLQGDPSGMCTIRRIPSFSTDNYPSGTPDMGLIQAYKLDKTDGYWQNITIRDLVIDGNKLVIAPNITNADKIAHNKVHNIDLRLIDGVLIENCVIQRSLWSGVGTTGCQNVTIRDCDIDDCGTEDWDSEGISRNGISLNAVWYNPVVGTVVFEDARNYKVLNNRVTDAWQEGIQYISIRNILIDGNSVTGCMDRAIEGDNAFQGGEEGSIQITNNYCVDNRWGGITFRSRPANQYIQIIGNIIRNASRYAISVVSDDLLTQTNEVLITSNIIENIGYESPGATGQNVIYIQANKAIVSNNIIKDAYQRSVSFQQCVDGLVHDNVFHAVEPYSGISGVGVSVPSTVQKDADDIAIPINSINIHDNNFTNYSQGVSVSSGVPTRNLKASNNTFTTCFRPYTIGGEITNVILTDNTVVDTVTQTTNIIAIPGTIAYLQASGNVTTRTSKVVSITGTVTDYLLLNNSDGYNRFKGLTAAPTANGTSGDIVWNSSPIKGQPIGWVYAQGNQTTNIQGWLAIAYPEFNGLKRALSNNRPVLSGTDEGHQFYDRSLGRWIYWNGTAWVEDTITPVLVLSTDNTANERTILETSYNEKKEIFIKATSTTQPCIVYLSLATSAGRLVTVKKTDASGFDVVIYPRGSTTDTIEGSTEFRLTLQNESVALISDGQGNWNIINHYMPS